MDKYLWYRLNEMICGVGLYGLGALGAATLLGLPIYLWVALDIWELAAALWSLAVLNVLACALDWPRLVRRWTA